MFEGSFMRAPIDGRSGPVGAHPRKDGGTARTLAGSVRYDEIHYTVIHIFAYSTDKPLAAAYTESVSLS